LQTTEKQKLLRMEKSLRKEVVGQDEAVSAVADAIRLNRSGLSNQDRPIASFLFVGPTGTGKTLLAKALAKFLFDSSDAMLRIDASEYSEKHAISRLIGSVRLPLSPSYVEPERLALTLSLLFPRRSLLGTSGTSRAASSPSTSAASPTASSSSTRSKRRRASSTSSSSRCVPLSRLHSLHLVVDRR